MLGDYKENCFYWDLLKFIEIIIIEGIFVLYTSDLTKNALIINLVLIFYLSLCIYKKPYRKNILNKMDIASTCVCFLSFYFAIFISS